MKFQQVDALSLHGQNDISVNVTGNRVRYLAAWSTAAPGTYQAKAKVVFDLEFIFSFDGLNRMQTFAKKARGAASVVSPASFSKS